MPNSGQQTDQILDHIAEVSKNARATWFGLLGLLVFVGVTLLGHKDADFFAYGAETELPLVNVDIPVTAFFVFAPVLVAALYIYLQLYLLNLWDALADAPARVDGKPLADRVYPWLITHAALWHRHRTRDERCISPRPMHRFVVSISLLLGAFFGVFVLGALWVRSMPAHEEWLTLWIGAWFFLATLVGITGVTSGARRMAGKSRGQVSRSHGVRRRWSVAFGTLLAVLSWALTEGGFENYWKGSPLRSEHVARVVPLYRADLVEAELTRMPPGWLPWHLWREDFEEKFRRREGLDPGTDLSDERKAAFEKEAKERYDEYVAQLAAPDLLGADLRNARMANAFLPGADLREAKLQGVRLRAAQMQGADLREAEIQGAVLRAAQMQGADLSEALIQGADLRGAQMQGANLRDTQMRGADLRDAQMQGADFSEAQKQGADLSGAKMQGADLSGAVMQGADLSGAEMQGADFFRAEMQGVNLRWVQMQGTDLSQAKLQKADLFRADMQGTVLRGAELQDAVCTSATLHGALLQSANATCKNLTQDQLEQAVGNSETVLPDGLNVVSCLETLPSGVEAALSHIPEAGDPRARLTRTKVRDALLCDRDGQDNLIEQPRRVGRAAAPEQ